MLIKACNLFRSESFYDNGRRIVDVEQSEGREKKKKKKKKKKRKSSEGKILK